MRLIKDSIKNSLKARGYTLEKKSPFEEAFKTDFDIFQDRVSEMKQRHVGQTKEDVEALKTKYENTFFGKFYVWDLVSALSRCFDFTDYRLGVGSQEVHVLQMIEAMQRDGITDRNMFLAAIIHDLGKVLLMPHEPPEYVGFNNALIGEYEAGIGLENCTLTYSQDEYLYSRLKDNVPDWLSWLVRYHGINIPECEPLMNERDREYTDRYLRTFAKYDMGSKSFYHFPQTKIEDYRDIIEEAFPNPILF
jgi:Myo-inositol oxygenase